MRKHRGRCNFGVPTAQSLPPQIAAAWRSLGPSISRRYKTSKPCADLGENSAEHFFGQHAGIGVVAGAMITVDERNHPCTRSKAMARRFACNQDMLAAMREGKRGRLQAEGTDDRLMGDPAEGDNRA